MAAQTTALLVFTFDKKVAELAASFEHIKQKDNYDYPYSFTKGFRQIFWRVFNEVLEKKFDKTEKVTLFSQKIGISRVTIFESDAETDLYAVEKTNYFIAFHAERARTNGKTVIDRLRDEMFNRRQVTDEDDVFDMLADQLKDQLGVDLRDYYRHSQGLTGGNFYELKRGSANDILAMRYLTVLYHFGKVIYWRITRNQVDLEIKNFQNNEATFQYIGDLKLQVLNLKRFFDIRNVSNTKVVKEFNSEIRRSMGMGTLYANSIAIQNSISDSIEHLDKLNNYNTKKSVDLLVKIMTFIALPLSIVSTLMALNHKSTIVGEEKSLLLEGQFVFIYVSSLFMPALTYLVIRAMISWRTKRNAKR